MKGQRITITAPVKMLLIFLAVILVFAVVWLARLRPEEQQKPATISTFEECVAAGNPVQESYPPVCATPDHQRFIGPR